MNMTINDLRKVYSGKVFVTALAFNENDEYLSFRTLHDDYEPEKITELADYVYFLEILKIYPDVNFIKIDVKETV